MLLTSVAALVVALSLGLAVFRGIRATVAELLTLNTNLESLVETRTRDLAARERSLRLVLDSTGEGLIRVARDGKLGGEVSAVMEQWFGTAQARAEL